MIPALDIVAITERDDSQLSTALVAAAALVADTAPNLIKVNVDAYPLAGLKQITVTVRLHIPGSGVRVAADVRVATVREVADRLTHITTRLVVTPYADIDRRFDPAATASSTGSFDHDGDTFGVLILTDLNRDEYFSSNYQWSA